MQRGESADIEAFLYLPVCIYIYIHMLVGEVLPLSSPVSTPGDTSHLLKVGRCIFFFLLKPTEAFHRDCFKKYIFIYLSIYIYISMSTYIKADR